MTTLLIAAAVITPLSFAVALAYPAWRRRVVNFIPLSALPALLLALGGTRDSTLELPWIVKDVNLRFDSIAQIFLLFTSILWLASGWYALTYLSEDRERVRFYLFFTLAMAGNFTLILANDIPSFYIGFAVMSLASSGLVVHRGDQAARRAARTYIILVLIGEVLLFAAFAFLFVNAGTLNLAELHKRPSEPLVIALILIAFGIKAGSLSLHFWLPLAHPAAPVPASAVLSGAMIKAGLLGWLRFLPLGEWSLPAFGYLVISGGLGAAFLGTFVGVTQRNPKAVLAYSSISQMGIVSVGVGIGLVEPSTWPSTLAAILIYSAHHGLAKGALFLSVGPAQAANGSGQRLWLCLGLIVPALALAGAPFSSGALAKVALKSNVTFLPNGWATWVGILLPLAAIGTALKMFRFLSLIWPHGNAAEPSPLPATWKPWALLVCTVLTLPWFLPGSADWLPLKLTLEKLWLATWPILAGAALAYCGARLQQRYRVLDHTAVPAGDYGMVLEALLSKLANLFHPSAEHHGTPLQGHPDGRVIGIDLQRLNSWLITTELSLRRTGSAGGALLILIIILAFLLTVPVNF